jgi:hypothetical protein
VRRVFWVAFGAAAGVLVVRRLGAAVDRWSPEGIAAQAGGAGERLALWWAEVRALSAQREAELRDALGLEEPGLDEADEGGSG